VIAVVVGLGFPRIETRIFHGLTSTITIPAAMTIYSSIASGMLALSDVVFSLAFVMIQFSAMAYSPRLVLWISRDPFMWHAVGVFTATFLFYPSRGRSRMLRRNWRPRSKTGRGWACLAGRRQKSRTNCHLPQHNSDSKCFWSENPGVRINDKWSVNFFAAEKRKNRRKPMTENEADDWFESREGQYFCKQCNQLLVGVAMKEAFVLDNSSEGTHYQCDSCGQNVILPSSR
jgi:Predicted membrane protein (DUF2254)